MAQNPYSTPVKATSSIPDRGSTANASQGKRFLGYIVDVIIMQVTYRVVGAVLTGIFVAERQQITPDEAFTLFLISFAINILIYVVYFAGMESVLGRTIGKFATGTKVVAVNGRPPSIGQVFGRTFARLVPFEPFSFFWGCDTKFPTGWHDRWSSTRVVDINKI